MRPMGRCLCKHCQSIYVIFGMYTAARGTGDMGDFQFQKSISSKKCLRLISCYVWHLMETYVIYSGKSLPACYTGICCVLHRGKSVSIFRTDRLYPEDGLSMFL
jgi:hypothetical protein